MTQKTFFIPTAEAMQHFGEQVGKYVTPPTLLFLSGDLGAGKTTFARGFLRGRGYTGKVKSPTYTIVEPYDLACPIYHFDFYRIQSVSELTHIGIDEYLHDHAITLIEWPEKMAARLRQPDLSCYIAIENNQRTLTLQPHTANGNHIMMGLGKFACGT